MTATALIGGILEGRLSVGGTMSESSTEVDDATGINKLVVKHSECYRYAYIYQYIEAVNIQGLYRQGDDFLVWLFRRGGSGIPKVRVQVL